MLYTIEMKLVGKNYQEVASFGNKEERDYYLDMLGYKYPEYVIRKSEKNND